MVRPVHPQFAWMCVVTDSGYLADHDFDHSPDGLRFHLADIYLTELTAVAGSALGPNQTVAYIEPWIKSMGTVKK